MMYIRLMLIFLSMTLLWLGTSYSQTPQYINYQGVARDAGGQLLAGQSIGLRISILNTSPNGAVQMMETHVVVTNQFGLFNIQIGNGSPIQATLTDIDWSSASKWLKVEMDPNGTTNYTLMGTQQLISVPYALYAKDAGGLQGNPVSQLAPLNDQVLLWDGSSWIPSNSPQPIGPDPFTLIYTTNGF